MSRTTRKVISKSQELRNIYFNLWEQDNEEFQDFDSYYENKMDKLIKHFKTKLV